MEAPEVVFDPEVVALSVPELVFVADLDPEPVSDAVFVVLGDVPVAVAVAEAVLS